MTHDGDDLTVAEMDGQHATELPDRDLLLSVSLLGLPLLDLNPLSINIDTTGPAWLVGPS